MSKIYKDQGQAKLQAAALKTTSKLKPIKKAPETRNSTRARFSFFDYTWISLMWLGISYLWGGVNGVILPNLNSRFIDDGIKGSSLGIITAAGMVVAIIVQPAAGALSDINRSAWGRRRPFILAGGVTVVLVLIFMAAMVVFFGNWWMLLVFYLLLQLSDNIVQGAYQGIIPDCVPTSRRGKASGAMGIAQIIGNVGGLAVATYFIDQGQPDLALILIAIVFSVTLIGTLFKVREEPLDKNTRTQSGMKVVLGTLRELKQHPMFVRFIISRLFVLTALATITIFGLYYLQDVLGIREGTLTESYTLLGIVVIVFSLLSIMPAVWLGDRIGRKKVIIITCAVGAIGMVLLATANNMTQVIIYGSLIGVATGSFNSLDWALATDLIPSEAAGRFMGVSNLAGAGSQALAALVGGFLRDSFNAIGHNLFNITNMGYTALFVMGTGYFVLGIVFLQGIKEPPHAELKNKERIIKN
jgi:MFS family permease